MSIHHATIAKAAKLGVVMTQELDAANNLVTCAHWTEKNKRAYGLTPPDVLADMQVWQMVTREYANWKVEQPYVKDANFVWEISVRKDVIGEGERLNEAFDDAIDAMASKLKGQKLHEPDDGDEDEEEGDEDNTDDDAAIEEMEEEAEEGKSVVKKKYKSKYRPFKMTCGDELSQLITAHVTVKDDEGKHIDRKKLITFAKKNGAWDERYVHLNNGMARMNISNRLRALVRKGHEVIWN